MKILVISLFIFMSSCSSKPKTNLESGNYLKEVKTYSECELAFGVMNKDCVKRKQIEDAGKRVPFLY